MVIYRACNTQGRRFTSVGRSAVCPPDSWALSTSPFAPDFHDDLLAFPSREDPPAAGSGTFVLRLSDAQATQIAPWRSWYPGRFSPDGVYFFSGKKGDLGHDSGRASFWTWKDGVLRGPFPSGTTNIEGIADFVPTTIDGIGSAWMPMWQNRAKTVPIGTKLAALWTRAGSWVFIVEKGTDQTLASKDGGQTWYRVGYLVGGVWRPVPTPLVFPCVKEQTDGTLLVAWNVSDHISFLSSTEWPLLEDAAPVPPPVPPPPPAGVEPQTKYPRPIFFAPYDVYAKPTYGNSARPIGNVAFPWLDSVADTRPLPIIVGYDTFVAAEIDRTMYYYIHANGDDAHNGWQSAAAQWDVLKHKPERPVILYLDSRAWPAALPAWLPKDRAFLAVQAYPNAHETPNQFKTAMREMCSAAAKFGLPLVLTPCFYTRNGTLTIAHVRAMMPVYDALVHEFKIVGIMPFSDMRTGQGMAAHPELYDDAQRMFNAIPTRPNRYTYWTPSDPGLRKQALKDQVRYEISGFAPAQVRKLLQLIDDDTEDD